MANNISFGYPIYPIVKFKSTNFNDSNGTYLSDAMDYITNFINSQPDPNKKAYIVGFTGNGAENGTGNQIYDNDIYINGNGELVAKKFVGQFEGAISGNMEAANKLTTARNINGTPFNGTQDITTTKWGAERILTIGNSSKTVDGCEDISWSLDEIGAISASVLDNMVEVYNDEVISIDFPNADKNVQELKSTLDNMILDYDGESVSASLLDVNNTNKKKITLLQAKEDITLDYDVTETLKNLSEKYTENPFNFDSTSGNITINCNSNYVKIKVCINLFLNSENEERIAFFLELLRNETKDYSGYTFYNDVFTIGGTNDKFKYKTIIMESPILYAPQGTNFKITTNRTSTNATLAIKEMSWITVEEINDYL